MNILFADGNTQTTKQLIDSVHLERLGISAVYTAESASAVLENLRAREVNILFLSADLDDGTELLRRIREITTRAVIVLYAHAADVASIRRVMRFNVFDFLTPPITAETLHETLTAVVEEAQKQQRIQRFYRSIVDVRQVNRRTFWGRLLSGDSSVLNEQSYRTVGSDQEYHENARFLLCILSLADGTELPLSWKSYALFNVLGELIAESGFLQETIIPLQDNDWCCVLRCEGAENAAALNALLEQITGFVQKELNAWLNCYCTGEVSLRTAQSAYKKLTECFEDDVTSRGSVYSSETYAIREIPYAQPPIRDWGLLLTFRRTDDLLFQINAYLDRLAVRQELNLSVLKSLRIDVQSMVQTAFYEKQLSPQFMLMDARYDTLRENSQRSVDHMKRFLEYMVRTTVSQLSLVDETQSIVGRVKDYINAHFSEDITRSSMARVVFLNPDYLARIFKKETGQSLGAYVKERRIFEAKKLLAETGVQVNEIALRVGFDNSSYFSHIFHQHTGMTPNEYRKQNTK